MAKNAHGSFADRDQPRAAVGTFPYCHRSVAEIDAEHRLTLSRAFATIIPVPARRDGGTGLVTPLDARAADSFSTAHGSQL